MTQAETQPDTAQQRAALEEMRRAAAVLARVQDSLLRGQYAHLAGRIEALIEILDAGGAPAGGQP